MDNLTHSLVGALLGQAGLKTKTGLAMPALIIGANIPDVDAACFFWLEGEEHLGFRRGITHGPPAMLLLPLILAGLLWGYDRWQTVRGKRPENRLPVSFKWIYIVSLIGTLSHPALDWLNVYGVRLLEPFSSQWFYGDTLFIIDVWLWALMGFATWFSLRREKRGGEWIKPARIALTVSVAYIAMNGAITYAAEEREEFFGPTREAIASPVPFAFWQREMLLRVGRRDDRWVSPDWYGDAYEYNDLYQKDYFYPTKGRECVLPGLSEMRRENSQLDAFLFWSRAPFARRREGGGIILYDARFYDPRARDRFSVALPDVECEELPSE